MTINIMDNLVLDDNNSYMVISKTEFNNKTYYCLMSDNNKWMFGYVNKDIFNEVKDEKLNHKLLLLFTKEILKFMNK